MSRVAVFAPYRAGHARLTNALLVLFGLGLLLLARQFNLEQSGFHIGFSGVSSCSVVVFSAAALLVLTQPADRWTLRIIVGFAVAFRAMTYFQAPFLSSDVYRYVWDGIVQHAHVNPYRYVPGNAALAYLREPNQDIFESINRRDYAVTIYPPAAQMFFWLVTWFSPTVEAMKLFLLGCEAITVAVLIRLLRAIGRRPTDVLLYAWAPVLVWEIGNSGHLDAEVITLIVLALWFRWRENDWMTGLFLGLAVFTKFYPVVLLPALWRRGDWKMPAAVVAVGAVTYPLYLSVGSKVFGFLGGYTKEEGMNTGERYFLLEYVHHLPALAGVPKVAFLALCAAVIGGILWWAWRKGLWARPVPVDSATGSQVRVASYQTEPLFLRVAMAIAFAMMLLFSPHYPWYIVWLIPFVVLTPRFALFTYLMAFYFGYTTGLADPGPKMFLLNTRLYWGVAAAFAVQWAWGWWYARTAGRRGPAVAATL